MTVVEGWFGDVEISQENFRKECSSLNSDLKNLLVEQSSINRTAYLIYKDSKGIDLDKPLSIGNKTEGALMNMVIDWGFDVESVKLNLYHDTVDKLFPFDSDKKRSTVVLHKSDGTVRLYCKGASEWLLKDCTHYTNQQGVSTIMNEDMKNKLESKINSMAVRALRTLMLCHVDFKCKEDLPVDWETSVPDDKNLCCDCVVGIIGE